MLAPVSYQALTEDEVYGLYADVTAELSVPLCVYDNPGTTHFAFSDDLHARVAALPGVRAIKLPGDGAGERIAALRPRVPESVALGFSGDQFAAGALNAGADVWFSVLGGLFPEARARDRARRRAAAARLEPLWVLFRRHGERARRWPPRRRCSGSPASTTSRARCACSTVTPAPSSRSRCDALEVSG